jgi:hypothetical protein
VAGLADVVTFRHADQFWSPVVRDTLWREWKAYMQSGVHNARTMLERTGSLGDFSSHRTRSGVDRVLERYWGANRERHLRSLQATGEKPADGFPRYTLLWKRAARWLAGLSTLALILAFAWLLLGRSVPAVSRGLLGITVIFASAYILNLFICGLLSTGVARFSERLSALPPLVVAAMALWQLESARARSEAAPAPR